jgi:putative ABC transport system permease protein
MFSHYFKTAVRNIWRHRVHSILNITGLAVGMACTITILLWVRYEFSFDRYHKNAEHIYRLATDFHFGTFQGKYAVSNNPAGPTLQRDYPEVEKAVRFHQVWGTSIVRYKVRKFVQHNMFYADNTVFEVFTLPLLRGNPGSALTAAYSVVITKGMATKYFGTEDPLGKVIKISNATHKNLNNEPNFTVTGVVEKLPPNSHFTFDMLLSYETFFVDNEKQRGKWTGNFDNYTYLLLAPNTDYREIEKKLPALVKRYLEKDVQDLGASFDLFLQPLTRIHLYSHLKGEIAYPGIIEAVVAFIGIAILILIIACINFMNLSTARSTDRAREIGIRKALGATVSDIVLMLSKSFVKWVLVANIFAWPLAYWFTKDWLEDYPYRIDVGIGPYALAGLIALAIALLTVGYQTINAARRNPVDALRYE